MRTQGGFQHRAVVLDPHPLWLDAVERVLVSAGVEVVAKTRRPTDALAVIESAEPDLLIFDPAARDEDLDGWGCLARARELVPGLKGVVMSPEEPEEPRALAAAFEAGVAAYVVTTARPDDIAAAVSQAFEQSVYLAGPDGTGAVAAGPGAGGLTPRERSILVLVADGHSNIQIASSLGITEQTVKFHLSNLYRKLGLTNRTQAAQWARVHAVAEAPTDSPG